MKKYTAIILVCFTLLVHAQVPTFEWAKQMGGDNSDTGHSMAIDANGNIYTIGEFRGTVDFDPGPDIQNFTSVGSTDIFIQKLDTDGNLIWAKQIGGSGFDYGHSITIDNSGNIYTTGRFAGTVDFDPGPNVQNLAPIGWDNIFIQKLDTDGNFLWAKQTGGAYQNAGNSITTDADGNVYTTGHFTGTSDFDPGPGIYNLTTIGDRDAFIQKLDTDGNFLWAKNMGGQGIVTGGGGAWTSGLSNAVDANGNVYTAGFFEITTDFDPGPGVHNLTPVSNFLSDADIFIQKLDADGNFLWAKRMDVDISNIGSAITIDADGNVYATGDFFGTVDFNPGPSLTAVGSWDIFVLKLDADSNFLWVKQMGGSGSEAGNSITTDADGHIYMTGDFSGTADFDPGADIQNLTSAGDRDIFIQKLDMDGNFLWVKQMGGGASDIGNSIVTDADGNIYTMGGFRDTADFDPNIGVHNLTSFGQSDIFIQKLSQCNGVSPDVQTVCSSYTWIDGIAYTESNNTAIFTIENGAANGCDSIITLDLTITPVTGTDSQTACSAYTWIDGNTYTESNNTATYYIPSGAADGCDSLVTLDLTINNVSDITTHVNGPTILANNSHATYQWIDCDNNNAPISGATNQDFTPTVNGNYAVEITENGCTETSDCILITTVGLVENQLEDEFVFFPNPTTGNFTIEFDNIQKNLTVRLFAISGQLIEHNHFQNTQLIQLDINYPNGIYILEISDDDGNRAMLKLLKQ